MAQRRADVVPESAEFREEEYRECIVWRLLLLSDGRV